MPWRNVPVFKLHPVQLPVEPEEVRQGQKVINEMITCLCKLNAMEIIPEAFSPLYPWAFIIVINSLDSPDNMLANNALYP